MENVEYWAFGTRWHKNNAYSDPDVFFNSAGSCSIGARIVGVMEDDT